MEEKNEKIIEDFSEKIQINIKKKVNKYIKNSLEIEKSFDSPITYNERQFNSILTPCLYELSDLMITELPINRKSKDKTYSHRLDFWSKYKNLDILIEVKHSTLRYNCSRCKDIWKDSKDKLKEAQKQLNFKSNKDFNKGIKLIILVINIFGSSNKSDKETINDTIKKYQEMNFDEKLIIKTMNKKINKSYFNEYNLKPKETISYYDKKEITCDKKKANTFEIYPRYILLFK